MIKVVKFGGSSLASATQFAKFELSMETADLKTAVGPFTSEPVAGESPFESIEPLLLPLAIAPVSLPKAV